MKKILYLLVFSFLFIGINEVKASTYYTNTKGVDFTKEQYDFITDMYYDGYQDVMSKADLDKLVSKNIIGKPISKYTLDSSGIINDNPINTRSTSVYYAGRRLTIGVSCDNDCLITLTAKWEGTPTVQSWDVIGFRTYNMTGIDPNAASVVGTGYSATYFPNNTQFRQLTNGWGYSVKLGNANNLKISTSMYANIGGTAYGSYQHAGTAVTLATSKLYTISIGGYGSVFAFYGAAAGQYDGAPGVYKNIA